MLSHENHFDRFCFTFQMADALSKSYLTSASAQSLHNSIEIRFNRFGSQIFSSKFIQLLKIIITCSVKIKEVTLLAVILSGKCLSHTIGRRFTYRKKTHFVYYGDA